MAPEGLLALAGIALVIALAACGPGRPRADRGAATSDSAADGQGQRTTAGAGESRMGGEEGGGRESPASGESAAGEGAAGGVQKRAPGGAAGSAGAGESARAETGATKPEDGTRTAKAARSAIERLVSGMSRAIDEWDGPAYVAPLAPTETLIFVGSDSTELSLGYDAIAPEILKGFADARAGKRSGFYRHTGLAVGAAADGKSGWWVQEMEYRFKGEDGLRAYPFRISGFAANEAGRWRVYLAHAALPVPRDEISRFVRPPRRGTPVPRSEPGARSAACPGGPGSPPGEAGLRDLVRELAARYNARDVRGWLELFAREPDVQLIGWAPSDVATSRADVAAALENLRSRYQDPGVFISDSIVVRALPDAGWWYEKGRLRFGAALDQRDLPYRSTGAAVRRGGAWRIVQWHADVPVPNDSTALFSHLVSD